MLDVFPNEVVTTLSANFTGSFRCRDALTSQLLISCLIIISSVSLRSLSMSPAELSQCKKQLLRISIKPIQFLTDIVELCNPFVAKSLVSNNLLKRD